MTQRDLKKLERKSIRVPNKKELTNLGIQIINAMIHVWCDLKNHVDSKLLRIDQLEEFDGVDSRHIENFIWASSLIELCTESNLSQVVPKWSVHKKQDDALFLIEEILQTKIKDNLSEHFVSDLVYQASLSFDVSVSCPSIHSAGDEAQNILRLNHMTVTKREDDIYLGIHLSKVKTFFEKKDTFAGLDIKTILLRLECIKKAKVRFGGNGLEALLIPLSEIDCILDRVRQQPVEIPEQEEIFF